MVIYSVVAMSIVGVVLLSLGLVMVVKAIRTKRLIQRSLLAEDVSTPGGGWRKPGEALPSGSELISDARTAWLRAEGIRETTEKLGTFQTLAADSPERAQFLEGLSIRTTLYLVIASYGIANVAIGTGVALMLVGAAMLGIGVPVVAVLAD